MSDTPLFTLSHYQMQVTDLARMAGFYTGVLGFLITDQSEPGPTQMIFMTRNPAEHHQIVLVGSRDKASGPAVVDHLAFRVADLTALRRIHAALSRDPEAAVESVSHGTSWSLYFRDPEQNRVEVFVDTPSHVDQPVRFAIDLALSDDELRRTTEAAIGGRPGFQPIEAWRAELARRLA